MSVTSKWGVATCPSDGDVLVSTLEFRGKEFICMTCRSLWDFLQPTPQPETPERLARLETAKAEYQADRRAREVALSDPDKRSDA